MYHEGYDDERGDGLSFHSSGGIDEAEQERESANGFEERARDRDGNLIARGRGNSATKRPSIEPFRGPITMGMPGEGGGMGGGPGSGGAR